LIYEVSGHEVQVKDRNLIYHLEQAMIHHHPQNWTPVRGDAVVADFRQQKGRRIGLDLYLIRSADGKPYGPNSKRLPEPGQGADWNPETNAAPIQSAATRSALHKAAAKGDLDGLRSEVENGADPNTPDSAGDTPLQLAAARGDWRSVEFLLSKNASVDAANAKGDTALHAAARVGALEVGEALLRAGADPRLKNKDGKTPLDLVKACSQGSARELEAALSKASL